MHNKFVNRTFFASLRFAVASPLYPKTPLHKKCLLQRRYGLVMNEKVFFTFWAFLMLSVISRFYFHKLFLERIESAHSELYVALGKPKVFTRYPVSPKLIVKDLSPDKQLTRYATFMAGREWELLRDIELIRLAKHRTRIQTLFISFGFVGAAIVHLLAP